MPEIKKRQILNQRILEKEIATIGTTRDETKNSQDFRVLVALLNGDPSYLDPQIINKSSLGNVYSIWLSSYLNEPGMTNLNQKSLEMIIENYDFRQDETEADANPLYQKYLKGEVSLADIKASLTAAD